MADTNETIADIIAEKRREANYIVQVSQGKCQTRRDKAEDEARDIRREADRLEAAYRREKAEWVNANAGLAKLIDIEKVGDSAKLREALSKFCAYSAVVLNAGMFNRVHLEALLNMAKAALAAPPRNCDAMDWRTAWKIWREKFCPETPVGYSAVVKGTEAFMDWFTAPATEKEGDSDGNE